MSGALDRLPTTAIGGLLDRYEQPIETFEKVLLIEQTVYPQLIEQWKQAQDEKKPVEAPRVPNRKRRR